MTTVRLCLHSTEEPPRSLFRILPLDRLKSILETNQTALVSPLLWDDPYEAAPLRVQLTHPAYRDVDGAIKFGMKFIGEPVRAGTWSQGGGAIRLTYCQSWTATPETDTMWRAYSPGKDAVRLRVSTARLIEAFGGRDDEDSWFLAEVSYVAREELDEELRDGKACYRLQTRGGTLDGVHGLGWVPAVTRKRAEFRPEHEFRLIQVKRNGPSTEDWPKLSYHNFDAAELVEEITLDPRSGALTETLHVLREHGYQGEVNKSTLYQAPEYSFWNSTHPR